MERRQICWAHLIRKFVSFSERDGPAGAFGRQLLDYAGIVFDYWHDYKAGKLDRVLFQNSIAADWSRSCAAFRMTGLRRRAASVSHSPCRQLVAPPSG
jgi:hypothetical protein